MYNEANSSNFSVRRFMEENSSFYAADAKGTSTASYFQQFSSKQSSTHDNNAWAENKESKSAFLNNIYAQSKDAMSHDYRDYDMGEESASIEEIPVDGDSDSDDTANDEDFARFYDDLVDGKAHLRGEDDYWEMKSLLNASLCKLFGKQQLYYGNESEWVAPHTYGLINSDPIIPTKYNRYAADSKDSSAHSESGSNDGYTTTSVGSMKSIPYLDHSDYSHSSRNTYNPYNSSSNNQPGLLQQMFHHKQEKDQYHGNHNFNERNGTESGEYPSRRRSSGVIDQLMLEKAANYLENSAALSNHRNDDEEEEEDGDDDEDDDGDEGYDDDDDDADYGYDEGEELDADQIMAKMSNLSPNLMLALGMTVNNPVESDWKPPENSGLEHSSGKTLPLVLLL